MEGHPAGDGYSFSDVNYALTPGASLEGDIDESHDAATQLLGGSWRLPTDVEFQELIDNCDSQFTAVDGINGLLLTSRLNGAKLFLPAGGYRNNDTLNNRGVGGDYWSSVISSDGKARAIGFSAETINTTLTSNRYRGYLLRAVRPA